MTKLYWILTAGLAIAIAGCSSEQEETTQSAMTRAEESASELAEAVEDMAEEGSESVASSIEGMMDSLSESIDKGKDAFVTTA